MRRLQIQSIVPSTTVGVPSTITVDGDFTQLFHGREWIDGSGARSPFYTYTATTAPIGTGVLVATSFEVVQNSGNFNGRYTVITKLSAGGAAPSELISGDTVIRVNEAMPSGSGAELTSGYVTNISTFMLSIAGEADLLLLEQQNNATRPVEFTGNQTSGWGEVMVQNMLKAVQHYAGAVAPANPFLGQLWFDTANNQLKIYNGASFAVVNFGEYTPVRIHQATESSTWVVNHDMGLSGPPYIVAFDTFVETPPSSGIYKSTILPTDVVFTNANSFTLTFSQAYSGYVIISRG